MTKTQLQNLTFEDRNLELALEFDRLVLEHPEITDNLPQEAHIFFLPQDDTKLCEFNKKLAQEAKGRGEQVVFITIGNIRLKFEAMTVKTQKEEKALNII